MVKVRPRIFISTVSAEFASTRQLIANILTRLGYDPVWQDIFGTEPGDLRDILRGKIDSCQGLIHLAGHAYGFEPLSPDPDFGRCSYTQFEFLYAKEKGLKTWLFLPGDDCPRDTPLEQLDLPEQPQGEATLLSPADAQANAGDKSVAAPWALEYQQERRQLQAAYRAKLQADAAHPGHLRHEPANGEQLELAVERLNDDFAKLREEFQDWQQDVSTTQKRQTNVLGRVLAIVVTLLILGAGAFLYLKHRTHLLPGQVAEITAESCELTRQKIRAHLEEASQRALTRDLAEAQYTWQERERLKNAADAAHAERLSRIDALAEDFARLEGSDQAGADFDELTRIIADQGVEEALAWLESRRGGILQAVQRDLAAAEAQFQANQAAARQKLQTLLKGAQLAQSEGEEARAESLYRDVIAADPRWGQARYRFVDFLLKTKGPRRQTHATLAEAEAVFREAEALARALVEQASQDPTVARTSLSAPPDSPDAPDLADYQRELSVAHNLLGDIAVKRGDLEEAARRFGERSAI